MSEKYSKVLGDIKSVKYITGLKVCTNLGHKVVIVLGHPNFYIKFGFIPARPKGIVAPFSVPDEAFMLCELTQGALKGVRGIVKYPVAFDEV